MSGDPKPKLKVSPSMKIMPVSPDDDWSPWSRWPFVSLSFRSFSTFVIKTKRLVERDTYANHR